jgi:hypothetical protein
VRIVLAFGHRRRRLHNQSAALLIENAQAGVHHGGHLFDPGQGVDQFQGDGVLADGEILERALGLSAPERLSGHLHRAHAVVIGPDWMRHGFGLLLSTSVMINSRPLRLMTT